MHTGDHGSGRTCGIQGREAIDEETKRIFRSKLSVAAFAVDCQLRLAAPMQLRLQDPMLRDVALKAVTEQAENEQQALRSLLTPA